MKRLSTLVMFALFALLLAACAGQSAGPVATPTKGILADTETEVRLGQALAFLPAGYNPTLFFTDWMGIKANEGGDGITSQSPWSERRKLFLATRPYALISVYGAMNMQQHAQTWGWDFSDLEWEAMISLDAYILPGATRPAPRTGYVLKLRSDLDLAPIIARFTENGFTSQAYEGVDIYSHTPNRAAPWAQMADPAVLNTAILADAKVLILSEDLPVVETILDTLSGKELSLADVTEMELVLKALNAPDTAVIAGEAACVDWNPLSWKGGVNPLTRLSKDQRAEVQRLLGDGSPLHPYLASGMGYRMEDGQAANTLVLEYASSSDAEADLETRRRIIAEGSSLAGDQYSTVITVKSASRDDKTLVFELSPVIGAGPQRNRLPDLLMGNDMLFAACP